MGWIDRLLGREQAPEYESRQPYDGQPGPGAATGANRSPDEVALERYRYMLRTAPPEQIEQAHEEAFARLTPDQRRIVLEQLGAAVPVAERATSDDPRSLARMATRAEIRQPGTIERALGGHGQQGYGPGHQGGYAQQGPGLGSVLLTSLAAGFIGTAIAQSFFASSAFGAEAGMTGEGTEGDAGGDYAGDASGYAGDDLEGRSSSGGWGDEGAAGDDPTAGDLGEDFGGGEFGGGDFGGDFGGGDFGGDFGGGDF